MQTLVLRMTTGAAIVVALVVLIFNLETCTAAPAVRRYNVPMLFVFGDSFVDAGNNNHLNTTARANHRPYGIDFDGNQSTGRWSDGRIITDYLAQYLQIGYPPCFLDSINITQGANFGSAGSGILNNTHIGGEVLTFTDQVNGFQQHRRKLDRLLGRRFAQFLTTRSIFYINIGNNDVNDYVQDHNTSIPFDFRASLLSQMEDKIQRLYNLGARKFVIASLYALGCAPMYQTQGTCNQLGLHAAQYYNQGLLSLIRNLEISLRGLVIVYANTYEVMLDLHQNPTRFGFSNVTHKCCPNFNRPSDPWCYEGDSYCSNPSTYLFWDTAHPSDHFNTLAARLFWSGPRRYAFPINVRALAEI